MKKTTDILEKEWSFKWIKDEPTKIKRFVFFYEFGRELLRRLDQQQKEIFVEMRLATDGEEKNKAKEKFSEYGDISNEAIMLINQISANISHIADIVDTPFKSLDDNLQAELLDTYGDEVENLLTGGYFLHNYGLSLKPMDIDFVKKHPELEEQYEKRMKEFEQEFDTYADDPEHFWVITEYNHRDSEKQQIRQFREIRRRALIRLENNSNKKLVDEIKKASVKGKNEGKGDYLKHLKALGAYRAVQYYGNWEKAFEKTQTVDSESGYKYKSPLYSDDKRYWDGSEQKVTRNLREIFGWP